MSLVKDIKAFLYCYKEAKRTVRLRYFNRKDKWGHIGINSIVHSPSIVSGRENIFIGNDVNIDWDNTIYANKAKFIIKDNSGAAIGLRVITGNHVPNIGTRYKDQGNNNLISKEVVVEEDVWLAANVTLLAGAHICRGAIVGAGSVVRSQKVPPYAIVMGNPCKIVGFRYSPEEVQQHEQKLYKPEDRTPVDLLEKNYKKYFLDRMSEIKNFTRI